MSSDCCCWWMCGWPRHLKNSFAVLGDKTRAAAVDALTPDHSYHDSNQHISFPARHYVTACCRPQHRHCQCREGGASPSTVLQTHLCWREQQAEQIEGQEGEMPQAKATCRRFPTSLHSIWNWKCERKKTHFRFHRYHEIAGEGDNLNYQVAACAAALEHHILL
jgi:hypothetical protein